MYFSKILIFIYINYNNIFILIDIINILLIKQYLFKLKF